MHIFKTLTAITIVTALISSPVFFSSLHADDCPQGYIRIREDQEYVYCKERSVYITCVTKAGKALKKARPQCVAQVSKCFRNEQPELSDAALLCGLGCLGSMGNVPACLSACGYSGYVALRVYELCAADRWSSCLGDALTEHRKAIDDCKN